MRISIVTISYNQIDYLAQAVASVTGQSYPDLEYIVVDPGSTDGSRDLLAASAGVTLRLFEPDAGPADGLNKGFSRATGDLYGFLNSDDVLLPGALTAVAAYFSAHPEIDVVSGHSLILDPGGRTLRKCYSDRFALKAVAYGAVSLMQPSTFFKAPAFRKAGGFNPHNRSNWDGELWVDMALAGARFGLINQFLSGYRLHESSITGTGRLHARYLDYRQRMFAKIMGRPMSRRDAVATPLYRIRRNLENHRDLVQRVLHGPVYRRKVK